MAKDQGAIPTDALRRAPRQASAAGAGGRRRRRSRSTRVKFSREVRAEARKVTWTSWKETWITSVMVGIMVVLTSLFFFIVDACFAFAMNWHLQARDAVGS